MIVRNITGGGRLMRGVLGVFCFAGAAKAHELSWLTVVPIAFGVLCVFQAAVGM